MTRWFPKWHGLVAAAVLLIIVPCHCRPEPAPPSAPDSSISVVLPLPEPTDAAVDAIAPDASPAPADAAAAAADGSAPVFSTPCFAIEVTTKSAPRAARSSARPIPKIINGHFVPQGKYPWVVPLQYSDGWTYCTGTLVGESMVLSAAHCPSRPGDRVLVDCVDLDDPGCRPITITRVLRSSLWSLERMTADWQLLALEKPHGMPPARIAQAAAMLSDGLGVIAVGFGRTSPTGPTSRLLLETLISTVDHQTCVDKLSSKARVDATMLCALERDSASCNGDSGAGLMLADSLNVVAITSWGIGCMNQQFPLGVYSYIPEFRHELDACARKLGDSIDAHIASE